MLESTKWYLWHGNVYQALPKVEFLLIDLDGAGFDKEDARIDKMLKTAREFQTYISRNRDYIPNYGERYRNGEPISTAFVESAVNQVVSKRMAKKQQMQWSQRGAHLLLQVRTRVLNDEWEDVFREWYPGFGLDWCERRSPPVSSGLVDDSKGPFSKSGTTPGGRRTQWRKAPQMRFMRGGENAHMRPTPVLKVNGNKNGTAVAY